MKNQSQSELLSNVNDRLQCRGNKISSALANAPITADRVILMEWATSWPHHPTVTKSTHLKWRDLHPKGLWHKTKPWYVQNMLGAGYKLFLWGDDQSCNLRTLIVITPNSARHWKVSYCRKTKQNKTKKRHWSDNVSLQHCHFHSPNSFTWIDASTMYGPGCWS